MEQDQKGAEARGGGVAGWSKGAVWNAVHSNTSDVFLFFREKLKMKEREEAWVKIENLAKANPQVLKKRAI